MSKPTIGDVEVYKNVNRDDYFNNYYKNQPIWNQESNIISSLDMNSASDSASSSLNEHTSLSYSNFDQVQVPNQTEKLTTMSGIPTQFNGFYQTVAQNEAENNKFNYPYQEVYPRNEIQPDYQQSYMHKNKLIYPNFNNTFYPDYNYYHTSMEIQGKNHNNPENAQAYYNHQLYNNSYEQSQNISYNMMKNYYTQTGDSAHGNKSHFSAAPYITDQAQFDQTINNESKGSSVEDNSRNNTESPSDSSNSE